MEKKTIRSGAPFVFAGAGVLAVALTAGIGTISSYLIAAGVAAPRLPSRKVTPSPSGVNRLSPSGRPPMRA